MPELFEFQKQAVEFLLDKRSCLIGDDMGLGKTAQAIILDKERRLKQPNIVKTPKTLVVTYLGIFSSWENHFKDWNPELRVKTIDNKNRDPFLKALASDDADVFICHWQVLRIIEDELARIKWFHLIYDECVVPGTRISIPNGEKNIEDLEIGDVIYGYDHKANKVVETEVKQTFTRNTTSKLYNINNVIMTGNHPVYTKESKYINASALDSMSYTLLRLEDDQEKNSNGRQDLRVVQQTLSVREVPKRQASILQQDMLKPMEGSSIPQRSAAKEYRKADCRRESQFGKDSSKPGDVGIFAFRSKPIQRSSGEGKGSSNTSTTRIQTPNWWKWKPVSTSITTLHPIAVINQTNLVARDSSKNNWETLCDRHCPRRLENSNRGGWEFSPNQRASTNRSRKGQVFNFNWLDNFPIYQLGGSKGFDVVCEKGTRVYNIETGTGNYFANGILVHNCHGLQNRKSKQTKSAKEFKSVYKTGLSGTPAFDKPDDLWSILNWLYPDHWSSYWRYYNRHIIYTDYNGYRTIVGVAHANELQQQMSGFYLRRKKEEVLLDLPEKYNTKIEVDLHPKQARAYESMRRDLVAWVGEHEDEPISAPIVIAQLTRLQQFSDAYGEILTVKKRRRAQSELERQKSGEWVPYEEQQMFLTEPSTKLDALIQTIESTVEQVVVFSQFSQVIKLLGKRLESGHISHGLFIGETSTSDRKRIIDEFQSGKLKVFAGTIAAGGTGITLTAASTVVFIDRSWSAANNLQAEDRLHRIGQKNAVQVIDIISRGTIDAKRHEEIDLKWSWIKQLLGEDDEDD